LTGLREDDTPLGSGHHLTEKPQGSLQYLRLESYFVWIYVVFEERIVDPGYSYSSWYN
jgi:hypothetical protein